MSKILSTIPILKKPRSLFNLSHRTLLTHQPGRLYPTMCLEVLPGDKLQIDHQMMSRVIPLVSPLMHEVDITIHTYFVPHRLVWPDFYKWMVGDLEGLPPFVQVTETNNYNSVTSLANYLKVPLDMPVNARFSALPAASYGLIYNEYYRAQQFIPEMDFVLSAGDNTSKIINPNEDAPDQITLAQFLDNRPLKRAWEHDYFTAALPEPQAGDPVTLPLTNNGTVPVELVDDLAASPQFIVDENGNTLEGELQATLTGLQNYEPPIGPNTQAWLDPNGSMEVDINAEAVTINTFRRAQRIQMWLEQLARAGKRATEYLKVAWEVFPEDARLQRPEFIGGTKGSLVISEVLSSAQTQVGDNVTPVGQLAGHGIGLQGGNKFNYHAKEFGYVISMMSVRPRTQYMQGLHKMYSRFDRFDYADPMFGNLGEQEIKVKELYASGITVSELEETFGYIPRYAEYKTIPSVALGGMQTTEAYWTWSRQFDNKPTLNREFIECEPRTDIYAFTDPDIDQFQSMIFNNVKAIRKLPKYGVPML